METSDRRRFRSGLSELIDALGSARTATGVVDALWWHRHEAGGATAIGLAVADPEPRLLPGGTAAAPALDPLLVAAFAYASAPLFFGSSAALRETYPVLAAVGALGPGEACAAVPLDGPGTPRGALVVVWDRPRGFSPGDRGLLTALAALLSAELARTCPADRERAAAERLRYRLRPARLPEIAGVEVAVRHEPAEDHDRGLGFYDLFGTEEGCWRLVAGDVDGCGVAAAVLAGLARQAFRSRGEGGPAAALGRLDGLVRDFGDPAGRLSAVCVDLSRRGRAFALTAARAGGPPPMVLRGSGAVLTLDVPGGPLGADPDPGPVELGVELRPGDSVLLCAGGAGGGGLLGDPRFTAVVAGCAGWAPGPLLEHVGLMLAQQGREAVAGASFVSLRVRGGRTRRPAAGWPGG